MTNTDFAKQAAEYIQKQCPDFKPKVAVVLGSGLGHFASEITNGTVIRYGDLPQFPEVSVLGHQGQLTLGHIGNTGIICLQGRSHGYEGKGMDTVTTYVRTMKLLGCQYFIATNASGSMMEDAPPGSLMLVTDHINFQPWNPLVGPNDNEYGPRFVPLDNAYDREMQKGLMKVASLNDIKLHQGVYMAVSGPNYETAAEIRAFKILGAHAVGMSTVPEVLLAVHCGMKVAAIATITNYATGLSTESHSHDSVVQTAEMAGEKLNLLLREYIKDIA